MSKIARSDSKLVQTCSHLYDVKLDYMNTERFSERFSPFCLACLARKSERWRSHQEVIRYTVSPIEQREETFELAEAIISQNEVSFAYLLFGTSLKPGMGLHPPSMIAPSLRPTPSCHVGVARCTTDQ